MKSDEWLPQNPALCPAAIGIRHRGENRRRLHRALLRRGGLLQKALTRGNGLVGNDVSDNVRTIGQVPLLIADSSELAVRGEIYLNKADFQQLNAEFDNKYANPRNLAAGSLRNVKSSLVARVPLNMFVYEGTMQKAPAAAHMAVLFHLQELGFRINTRLGYFCDDPTKQKWVRDRFPAIVVDTVDQVSDYIRRKIAARAESIL